jgi:phosphoribosylformimino-5-aminoimidazole carboxamide ribonucleotide (ProFAR) isomerase
MEDATVYANDPAAVAEAFKANARTICSVELKGHLPGKRERCAILELDDVRENPVGWGIRTLERLKNCFGSEYRSDPGNVADRDPKLVARRKKDTVNNHRWH